MSVHPDQPDEAGGPSGREVLADRHVRNLLVANFLVFAGLSLQFSVLSWEIFQISGREMDLAWLGLAEFAPAPLLVLFTGTVADRFNRRTVSAVSLLGEIACIVALAVYSASGPTKVWPYFVVAAVFGVFRAFSAPALRSIPAMVAPDGGLPRVVAMFSVSWTAAMILGAAMSGFLLAVKPAFAYTVAAGMVIVGLLLLLTVRFRRQPDPPEPDQRPTFQHAIEGLRFIRRTPVLLAAISLDLFAVLFGGAIALLPAIAEKQLHVGDVAYGWLRAATGIGAALTGLVLSTRPLKRNIGRSLLFAVAVFGIATIVLGATHSFAVAMVCLLVASGADMVSVFIRSSLVPLVTPDEKRGRVFAVENVFIGASNELGAFESGLAAQHLGLTTTVVGGGVATLGIVAAFWFRFPALRKIDRFEDIEAARPVELSV